MRLLIPVLAVGVLVAGVLGTSGCRRDGEETVRELGFDEFVPRYNAYIRNWILEKQRETEKELERVAGELEAAEGEKRELLEIQAEALARDVEKWSFRLELGDYLKIGDPSEIPADLVWEDGMEEPEIGDPQARKGGVLRRYIPDFPPTIRPFGINSNNGFRGDLYDDVDLLLVHYHRETMRPIPGVAKEWAVADGGRTIYFRIDPEARYSDGVPVRARDYLITVYVNVSDHVVNPYYKQYYRENLAQVAMYDDHTISISLPEAQVFAPLVAGYMKPSQEAFYSEYGPDYAERYQWRFPPTTGAYEVKPEDIVKGVSITQTRVEDWWAKDRKYYRYRFNPDRVVNTVVRDQAKAFELFRAGELDTFLITRPELWYEKMEMPPVYDGYVEKVTFHTRFPRVPLGIYLNVAKPPLDNRDVRVGINHAMHWAKVIEVLYRGDYERLNSFLEGYQGLSDPTIRARPYSIAEAKAAFRRAGYTAEGRDGILRKPGGERLSLAVTYAAVPIYDRIFSLLREEARACGLELRLDGLEPTVAYRKEMQKQHQLAFGAWITTPPLPDFHQYLDSSNAYTEKGDLRPQTNNIFSWARADTDVLSQQVRTATTMEELRGVVRRLQHIMHEEGIFVPGFSVGFVRVGSWRWVRWPDAPNTRFAPPIVYDPHEVHVLWIDNELKEETQEARRTGRVFPESAKLVDAYKGGFEEVEEPPNVEEPDETEEQEEQEEQEEEEP